MLSRSVVRETMNDDALSAVEGGDSSQTGI